MTIRELIRALEVYDSEKEVKLNDFHKGLDDIGVIKEVAEGHVEITRMGYVKEYFEKPLPTDEELKERGNLICRVMLRQLNCGFTKGKVTFSEKELRHRFETGQYLKEWKEWDTL